MTKQELINDIHAEITGSGLLPKIITDAEVSRVIGVCENFFFEMYRYATEVQRMVLPQSLFQTEQFKRTRGIILPENTLSVFTCQEIDGISAGYGANRDFSYDKMTAGSMYLSNISGSGDIITSVATESWYSLTSSLILSTVAYDFNKNTKKITILGHDPKVDLILEMDVNIEVDKLYNDHYFQRYCTAQSKISFSRIIGMYPLPLPGGIEINHDALRSEGETEVDEIKEYFDQIDVPDWYMTF